MLFFYKVLISIDKPIHANFIYKLLLNLTISLLLVVTSSGNVAISSKMAIAMILIPLVIILVILVYLVVKSSKLFSVVALPIKPKIWLVSGVSSMPFSLSLLT